LRSVRASQQTPWLEITRASAGIAIGLALGDDALVETFADESWIERALASRDAYSIGRIVYAFYELFRTRGDGARAAQMCAIALDRCASADCMWPMFAAVARDGHEAAVHRARALLDAFPRRHPIASAQRKLFEAVLADRNGNIAYAAQRAGEAYLLLDSLGLRYQATVALVLTGRTTQARARYAAFGFDGAARSVTASSARGRPRSSVESAQHRREIFGLLLEGASTKEIAERLGLSERTVKSRISEIYQLTGAATRHGLDAAMSTLL
jgi:DNA-binding CsgD family transcriptional regulator